MHDPCAEHHIRQLRHSDFPHFFLFRYESKPFQKFSISASSTSKICPVGLIASSRTKAVTVGIGFAEFRLFVEGELVPESLLSCLHDILRRHTVCRTWHS